MVATSRGRTKKGSGPRNKARSSKPATDTHSPDKTTDADADDMGGVTVVDFTLKPTVPVPAFITAAIMETYVSKPEELALMIVGAIKCRASEDPDLD